jgi:hypothetical protein
MPTKNRRAAVYLPPDVDEALAIFKDNRRIDGDSAALIAILREFFELRSTKAHNGSPELEERIVSLEQSQSALHSQVQSLERTVKCLLSEFRFLRSELPGELQGSLLSQDAQPSHVSTQLDLVEVVKVEVEVESMCLSQTKLSKRLGVSDRTLGRRMKDGFDGMTFEEWSKTADPDGIAWTRDLRSKKYRPLPEPS